MSSAEQTGVAKRSAHYGVAKTRIKALDDGVRKTIQNAIQRWQEKRIEFIEGLPERTQQELNEEGFLATPSIALPGTSVPVQPTKPAPAPTRTLQPSVALQPAPSQPARPPRI